MEMLLRGKYVLTSATEPLVLEDAAVRVSGDTVTEIGPWATLSRAHPEARVVGNGKQLLLPGLIDAHSHGRAISPIQKGVLNDYLEQRRRAEMLQRLKPYYQRWYRDWLHGETQPFYVLNSRI